MRADILKRLKCKLDQETGYISDLTEATPDVVPTEKPTDKTFVNMFHGEACFVHEPRNKKICLKENSTNQAPDERHKSLNINNLQEDIEEEENEQATESDLEIREFMQKY